MEPIMTVDPNIIRRKRAIGVAGTIARAAAGTGLLYLQWHGGLTWRALLLGFVVFPAVLLLWQGVRLRRTPAPLRATGLAEVLLHHAIVVVLIIIPFTRDATALFYGASMLLAAVRGYAGCEVLAITNWLLGRNDQAGCLVFSPLDALEVWGKERHKALHERNTHGTPQIRGL